MINDERAPARLHAFARGRGCGGLAAACEVMHVKNTSAIAGLRRGIGYEGAESAAGLPHHPLARPPACSASHPGPHVGRRPHATRGPANVVAHALPCDRYATAWTRCLPRGASTPQVCAQR